MVLNQAGYIWNESNSDKTREFHESFKEPAWDQQSLSLF